MIPGSNYRSNCTEDERREFKRQQERLKMMAPDAERKPVSADDMIFSLLQKSDTFKKATLGLPHWLRIDSPTCCPYYESVWNCVRCSEKMVDTPRISQILLTSSLHPDVLGYIWNLANKTTPGQLTKQELYIVLALVALAQSGRTFSNLSVLNQLSTAPIPRLQALFTVPNPNASDFTSSPTHTSLSSWQQQTSVENQYKSAMSTNHMGLTASTMDTKISEKQFINNDDDFQDFQSNVPPPLPHVTSVSSPTYQYLNSQIQDLEVATNFRTEPVVPDTNVKTIFQDLADLVPQLPDRSTTISTNPMQEKESIQESKSDLAESQSADDFTDFQNFQSSFDTEIIQPMNQPSLPKLSSLKVSPESERKLRSLAQPESLTALPESKISSNNQVSSMPSIALLGSSRGVGSRLANHALSSKHEKPRHHHRHYKIKPIVSAETSALPDNLFPRCIPKPPTTFLLKETKILSSEPEDLDIAEILVPENTRKIEIPSIGTFKETTLPSEIKVPTKEPEINSKSLLSMDDDKYRALRELNFDEPIPEPSEDFGEFISADLPTEKAVEAWSKWNSSVDDVSPETGANLMNDFGSTNLMPLDDSSSRKDEFDFSLQNLAINPQESFQKNDNDDDFGDFVAPEMGTVLTHIDIAPTEDQVSIKSGEGVMPRFGSWSSLDLAGDASPPVFHLNPKIESDADHVVSRCLACCHKLLKEAVDIFNGIQDRKVLEEVFSTEEAKNYLKYLHIVFHISQRIFMSGNDEKCQNIEISQFWEKLKDLAEEFSITLEEADSSDMSGKPCAVCRTPTSSTDIEEKGAKFHVSCANLWINCIDSALPCF